MMSSQYSKGIELMIYNYLFKFESQSSPPSVAMLLRRPRHNDEGFRAEIVPHAVKDIRSNWRGSACRQVSKYMVVNNRR